MDDPRAARLIGFVLRCYPVRWRRHGDEAAELAALLIGRRRRTLLETAAMILLAVLLAG